VTLGNHHRSIFQSLPKIGRLFDSMVLSVDFGAQEKIRKYPKFGFQKTQKRKIWLKERRHEWV
jgi:hypothetical protein